MTKTVLIVDDESHIRLGLRTILERLETPFTDVDECEDGMEALSRLTTTKIDLVIADIRMPRMDGLTLLQETRSLPHKPHFVFLTGFDDFRYAKLAVRFGACDYLLKPVDIGELRESLLRISRVIEEDERLRSVITDREDGAHAKRSCELGFIMMNDELSIDETRTALAACGLIPVFSGKFETFVIRIRESTPNHRRVQHSAWISLLLRNAFGEDAERFIVFIDRQGDVVIAGPDSTLDDRLPDVFSNSLGGAVPQTGRSGVMSGLEQVREAYSRARTALRYSIIFPHVRPISYCETPHDRPVPPVPVEDVQAIASLIGSDMIQEIRRRLMALFDVGALKEHPIGYLDALVAEIFHRVVVFWTHKFPRAKGLKDRAYSILESVDNFAGINEYLSHILSFIIEMDTYVVSLRTAYKDHSVMDAAVLWISENYADRNLTMALVAERFGFSYTYFSTAFREHTGMGFVHFLKRLRVTRATELMGRRPELRLNEIARHVGFPNSRLFTRTFRELNGIPPAEYRKNAFNLCDRSG